MSKGIIALDGDGVVVDYNDSYRRAWKKAFGEELSVVDPQAYHATALYNVPMLGRERLAVLKAAMDDEFWATMNAIPGAVEACQALSRAGYRLVCVTAAPHRYGEARRKNLLGLGIPVEAVYTTPSEENDSPKVRVLNELRPVAFVDDYLPYMRGVPSSIHRALIMREPNGSPNFAHDVDDHVDTKHQDLLSFAQWWLTNRHEQLAHAA